MTAYKDNHKPQASAEKGAESLYDPDDFLGRGVKSSNASAWDKEKSSSSLKHSRRDDSL